MTFTDRQRQLIDEWIDKIGDPKFSTELHEYLGLTWDEYVAVADTALVIEDNPRKEPDGGTS